MLLSTKLLPVIADSDDAGKRSGWSFKKDFAFSFIVNGTVSLSANKYNVVQKCLYYLFPL